MPKGQYERTDFHKQRISQGMLEATLQHSPETRKKISEAIKTIRSVKKNGVNIEYDKAASKRIA